MKKRVLLLMASSAFIFCGILTSCSSDTVTTGTQLPTEYRDIEFSPALVAVAESQNDFSAKFFSEMVELSANSIGNLMVSPLSAGIGLSILANTVDDETSAELLYQLGQSDLNALNSYNATLMNSLPVSNGETTLSLANSAWVTDKASIPESYSTMFYETYGDYPRSLNFRDLGNARKTIDGWCADRTNGLIKNICGIYLSGMQIMFANALYFASTWDMPFDSNETKTEPFTTTEGIKQVPMMNGEMSVDALATPEARSVKLYFHDKRYAMTIILPNEGISVKDFAKDADKLNSLLTSDYHNGGQYKLKIPKFSVAGKVDMNEYISANLPGFENGSWDKCGINEGLTGYTLVHHTKFIVDEKGAEASAATNSDALGGINHNTYDFYVDRPFIFAVTEVKTGTVILAGVINDPTLEDSGVGE